jgi:CRISPR/Cas system-associated exonuclease Cas4 (RecB family)
MQISKTDFLHFLRCPNSLWLEKHKPEKYRQGEFTAYAQKIAAEGYEVEAQLRALLEARPDAEFWSFQTEFRTDAGLYARVDALKRNTDGTVDLCEVKSSTSVKRDASHNQVKDAAFQVIAATDAGANVSRVFIVHLNSDYVRAGDIAPEDLLVFTDVTDEVREMEKEIRVEIKSALAHLGQPVIDESFCSCLQKSSANHCDAFSHFNPKIPSPSIYDLPRISVAKLKTFAAEGRFGLNEIGLDEVTASQARVLRSANAGAPLIDRGAIASFYSKARYPLWFLDYETYSSAIPLIDGVRPQAPIPFQLSVVA